MSFTYVAMLHFVNVFYVSFKDILASHLKLEADKNEANRVVECICLYFAVCGRNMSPVLKSNFCLGLSLHPLNDEQYSLFVKQFSTMKAQYEPSAE